MIDLRHLNQVWSEDACRLTASHFRALALAWERRAEAIKNFRGNMRPIEDTAPVLKASIRVLNAYKMGLILQRNVAKFAGKIICNLIRSGSYLSINAPHIIETNAKNAIRL